MLENLVFVISIGEVGFREWQALLQTLLDQIINCLERNWFSIYNGIDDVCFGVFMSKLWQLKLALEIKQKIDTASLLVFTFELDIEQYEA